MSIRPARMGRNARAARIGRRSTPTTLDTIRRTAFGLTPQRPLRAAINEERRFDRPLFDMHYELELGILLSGRHERRSGRHRCIAEPGHCWFTGIWEPHGYRVLTPTARALVLVIRPELLVELRAPELPDRRWLAPFAAPPARRPGAPQNARVKAQILAWAHAFAADLADDSPVADLRRRLQLLELLLLVTTDWQPPETVEAVPADTHARIGAAVELVFARRGNIAASEAARACALSRNQFDRLFGRLIGLTFARFVLRYRLGAAAQDLLATDEPLKKVARDWQFTDASHLVHAFRQHYGCTPLEYRRRRQEPTPPGRSPAPAAAAALLPAGEVAWNARVVTSAAAVPVTGLSRRRRRD